MERERQEELLEGKAREWNEAAAEKEIRSSYGDKFSKRKSYSTKSKGAQEAHEAIRPSDMSLHSVKGDSSQAKLYDLIWKRTLASQMSDAQLERTNVKIENSEICCTNSILYPDDSIKTIGIFDNQKKSRK